LYLKSQNSHADMLQVIESQVAYYTYKKCQVQVNYLELTDKYNSTQVPAIAKAHYSWSKKFADLV